MAWWTTLWQQDLWPVQWGAVLGASLAGAVTDIASRRISNRLTGPVFLAGVVWAAFVGGPVGVADSLAAAMVLALPYVLLFVFAGGGAGDAKMMGALGAWLGVVGGALALACVAAAGVVLAIVFAVANRQTKAVLANISFVLMGWTVAIFSRGQGAALLRTVPAVENMKTVPYGVAILVGMALAAGGMVLCRFGG